MSESIENKSFEELKMHCAVRAEQSKGVEKSINRLEQAVFGNGKDGMQLMVDRIGNEVKNLSQKVDEEFQDLKTKMDAMQTGITNLVTHTLDSKTVRAITREEIARNLKESRDEPGSWGEFRKTWLFPIVMMVVSAIVSAGLTYIVVASP